MCDPVTATIAGVATVGSALLGRDAAGDAADAQVAAADKASQVQWDMYEQNREDLAPWRAAGEYALTKLMGTPVYNIPETSQATGATQYDDVEIKSNALANIDWNALQNKFSTPTMFGSKKSSNRISDVIGNNVAKALAQSTYTTQGQSEEPERYIVGYEGGLLDGPGEFTESPGYQFRLDEGNKNILARASATGRYNSGATDKALLEYGQDYATNDYDNFLARYYQSLTPWQSLAGVGQTATNTTTAAGQNTANSVSNLISDSGEARASGYINQANAVTGGINNALTLAAMTYGGKGWGA